MHSINSAGTVLDSGAVTASKTDVKRGTAGKRESTSPDETQKPEVRTEVYPTIREETPTVFLEFQREKTGSSKECWRG